MPGSDRRARQLRTALRASAIASGCVLAIVGGATASDLDPNTWYQFSTYNVGDPTFGCDPADPNGLLCTASVGTPTVFAADAPWTFTLAAGTPFTVVDAFQSGDRYEVFDFGTSLGETSAPVAGIDCGADPVVCHASGKMSSRVYALAAGAHSITIGVTAGGTATGYFRIPEPSGAGALALACLALLARRRRAALAAALVAALGATAAQADATRFSGPTSSQPIALSADDAVLAVANPDDDSVTLFNVRNGRNLFAARIPVLDEPNGVALTPDGRKGFVANSASGKVSIFSANVQNGVAFRPHAQLTVGAEPYAVCMAPNGTRVYVANARSNTVTVIDAQADSIVATIPVGREPRGLALTNDGDDDDLDETLVVTSFLAAPSPGGTRGADDTSFGRITLLSTANNTPIDVIDLDPMLDTGFLAAGDALARIAPADPPSFTFQTGAFPNQLNGIALRGTRAFVPSTGASPNGPLRFDVNVQSLLSVIDLRAASTPGSPSTCRRRSRRRRIQRGASSRSRGRSRSSTSRIPRGW
jgi:YVTN family beta-propeller protein